jgi:predicted LPLAT superfamily acyltransferase
MKYPVLKAEWSIFRNYILLGKVLLDKVAVMAGFSNNFTFDFEGENYLHALAGSGKGGIIIGAHAGNWEIAGFLLKRINKPVHVLIYDGEQSNIKELLEKVSGGKSFNTILIHDNDFSHIYQISNVLQRGELIAMHGDRFMPGSKVHPCMFMGRYANFPLGPYYLSAQFKVPVCFVSTMKESNTHYHFYASAPVCLESEDRQNRKQEIINMAGKYAYNLEKMVEKYPLQWFNYYNFWNAK